MKQRRGKNIQVKVQTEKQNLSTYLYERKTDYKESGAG